jgi:amino acid transporter
LIIFLENIPEKSLSFFGFSTFSVCKLLWSICAARAVRIVSCYSIVIIGVFLKMSDENSENGGLQRTIDWKQGLAIALGVPVLILPSIGYFANYVWAFAIIIWALSVFQGFMQNFAYGELATMFPKASGLPGYAQSVFTGNASNRYDLSKLLGGFSAWSYWFAWNPVLAIYSILIGSYLKGLIPAFAGVPDLVII